MRHARTAVALLLTLLSLPSLAAITGTVVNADGQPVAGARVMIHALETAEGRRARLLSESPLLPALAETKTDAKGAFSLPSPKESVVDLRVEMRGYEPESRRIEKDEELGTVAITAREWKSGTITAAGKPVANATVVLSYGGAEHVARTDAEGRYEAPDLKRAAMISVLHPGFAIDEERFMNSNTPSSKLTRTLSTGVAVSGKVVTIDGRTPVDKAVISIDGWPVATSAENGSFVVARAPAKWSGLTARKDTVNGQHAFVAGKPLTVRVERSGVVSGRAVDAKTGVPIAGAMVRINPVRRMSMADPTLVGITDAKGVYSILSPPGTFMMYASHPAYDQQPGDVTVAAGQRITRDLTLTQLARVSGIVVDEERRPVAAARISSENAGMETMQMMTFRQSGGAVVTGSDGRFTIRLRPDSDLRLVAAKKGLPLGKGDAARYQTGERKTGVVLTIPSGVAVTGRVVDSSGKPLSGVAVGASETPAGSDRMVMRRMVTMGMPAEEEDAVRTASDGTFTMRLKEGTYDFGFRREGFAPKSVRAQNVTANATQPIEARLEVAAEITGRVTRGGVAVPEVLIAVMGEGDSSTVSGPDGSFTLTGLPAGSTRVMLRKEDSLINDQRMFTAPARDVVIDLPVGGTIRGRVVEKGSSKAINSFQVGVSASRSGGGMMMMSAPLLKSFTAEDGSFTLENVPSGSMNLVANAPGFAPARMNLSVEEGKTLSDVVVELETGVRLTGRVTGPNGAPLADATVVIQPSPTGSFAMTGTPRRTRTDANGEYSMDGLLAGEETISFGHAKYNATAKSVILKGTETKLDAQLEGGSKITGTVVTDAGMPVAEAEVEASGGASGSRARTNASGTFEMENMRPGRYRFSAAKAGFVEGVVNDVDISSGAPIRIVMQTGGTIYGRVSGISEADMANVTVTARNRGTASSAAVDPMGNFRIEGAPTGTVSVSASVQPRDFAGRRNSSTQTVELAAGGSQQVNIDFRGDVVIRGRVTRNGKALGNASVSFYPRKSGAQASASVSTDDQGTYSLSGLEDGEYNVTVVDVQRFSPYSTTYTVRGSSTFDIDYKAASIRGRVIDAGTGEAIENATVQFRSSTPGNEMRGTRTSVTDSTGVFSIDFVNPGSYVITASRDGFGNTMQDIVLGDAGREDLELKLSRNEGVTMSVVDARDGRSISGMVFVYDAQGRLVYDSQSAMRFGDAAKDLRLPLTPGSYTATVFSFNYAPVHVNVQSPSTPRVALSPGGTIIVRSKHNERRRMRLLDSRGLPYPRMGAAPMPRDLPPGTATLERIAPGTYTLVLLNDDESLAASQAVNVREGETVTVDL